MFNDFKLIYCGPDKRVVPYYNTRFLLPKGQTINYTKISPAVFIIFPGMKHVSPEELRVTFLPDCSLMQPLGFHFHPNISLHSHMLPDVFILFTICWAFGGGRWFLAGVHP